MGELKEKFIGFIDILEWEDFEGQAVDESQMEVTLADLVEAKINLSSQGLKDDLKKFGHLVCPDSKRVQQDLDIEVSLGSGCAVFSSEISPAGIITLIRFCHTAVKNLALKQGLLCRGYITRDMIFHSSGKQMGTGYHKTSTGKLNRMGAFQQKADDQGIPFVEIDPKVHDYITCSTDTCVDINYERLTQSDGDVTAIFPFKSEEHDFLIGDFCGHQFDANQERESNDAFRSGINKSLSLLEEYTDLENPGAVRKSRVYRKALENQLAACENTHIFLKQLEKSFHNEGIENQFMEY